MRAAASGTPRAKQGIADELDDAGTQQRPDDVSAPARQRRATDRDGGDSVEFHVEPDLVGVRGAVDGDHDKTGQAR